MEPNRNGNSMGSLVLRASGLVLVVAALAAAQTPPKSSPAGDERPDRFEIGAFGGGSFFRQLDQGLGNKLVSGGAGGLRVTENFWKRWGLEQSYTFSTNNMKFLTPAAPGLPNYNFGARLFQYNFNPVFYLKDRGAKVRPFFTIGVGAFNYTSTDNARREVRFVDSPQLGANTLDNTLKFGMNYGGGLKWHLTDSFGLRFDVRGLLSGNPYYSLAESYPRGIYIPRGHTMQGVQTTVGLTYYIGRKAAPAVAPPPPPPPPPPPLAALNAGTLSVGAGTLCQGRGIAVRSNASDPAGREIVYKWKVNGQSTGASRPELTFTPDRAGDYKIELEVQADNTAGMSVRTATANPLALNVQPYTAPTVSGATVNPAAIQYGQSAALTAQGQGSACSTISYAWSVTEGTIVPASAQNATFDSKTVRFEQGGKIQSKTVTATVKVTDDRGASASASVPVKVDYTPQSIRYADIIFGKASARVNNCGKRVLLEELAPKAADPDYEIILIGHIDQDEVSKTKLPSKLDMQRTMNAVAVLTAGGGTCASVDPSRIKVDWTGTEQVSDMQPGLCGTSARPASKERAGAAVSTADEKRRVEVWLVPKGTKLPEGFKSAKELPAKELKKLACPK